YSSVASSDCSPRNNNRGLSRKVPAFNVVRWMRSMALSDTESLLSEGLLGPSVSVLRKIEYVPRRDSRDRRFLHDVRKIFEATCVMSAGSSTIPVLMTTLSAPLAIDWSTTSKDRIRPPKVSGMKHRLAISRKMERMSDRELSLWSLRFIS